MMTDDTISTSLWRGQTKHLIKYNIVQCPANIDAILYVKKSTYLEVASTYNELVYISPHLHRHDNIYTLYYKDYNWL